VTPSCRDRCREAEEPLAGSAGRVAAWFGVAWPKPRWHASDASRSDGLPAELRALEVAEKRAGRELAIRLFQRESRPPTEAVEVLALDPRRRRSARVPAVRIDELAALLRRFLEGEAIGAPIAAPTLLVCTDGRHDRCCAAHGRPLFDAVRGEVAKRGLDVDVAQASHLGGHRFASTVLALPEGRLYGRLDAAQAGGLVEAAANGKVLAEHDRGHLALPEIEQVAEAAARSRHPDAGAIEVSAALGSREEREGRVSVGPVSVHRRGSTADLSVLCRRRTFESPASCGEAPAPRERWVAEAILPL
jgi:hypothetical protein